eukprot:2070156-Prymnesium_polylepis.1
MAALSPEAQVRFQIAVCALFDALPEALQAAAASGAAVAAAPRPNTLIDLNSDALVKICRVLASPLEPHDAVALGSTCRGLRAPTEAVVAELRQRHEAAKALCRKVDTSCAEAGAATYLP